MISKIEISGNNFKITDDLKSYAKKRIGKLDRYLPRKNKKDVIAKLVITETGTDKKYEISAAMEIPGGKVIAARDKCSNLHAGIDIIETKLMGQIRRYKTENEIKAPKKSIKNIFKKRS